LCFQERNTLVVRKAAAFQRFAVSAHDKVAFSLALSSAVDRDRPPSTAVDGMPRRQ